MRLIGLCLAALAATAMAGPDEDDLKLLRSKVRMLEATVWHQEEIIRLLRRRLEGQPTSQPAATARPVKPMQTPTDAAGRDRTLTLDTLLSGLLPQLPDVLDVSPSELKQVGSRAVLLPWINDWLTGELFARRARITGTVEGFRYPPGRERRFRLPDWVLAKLPTAPEEQIILQVRLAKRELWDSPHAATVALVPNAAWLAGKLEVSTETLAELNKGALGLQVRKRFMGHGAKPTITVDGWVEGVVVYTGDAPRIHITMSCQAPPKPAAEEDMAPLLPREGGRRRRHFAPKHRPRARPAWPRPYTKFRQYLPRGIGGRRRRGRKYGHAAKPSPGSSRRR